jgi:acetylornithine deacetylase/succinyl-diaminopimelate desuccinylase-like protein
VVVLGSLNADHSVRVDRLPAVGETVTASDYRFGLGGKGFNQAVTAARQGADVVMVGCVGDDRDGDLLLEALHQEGIDLGYVRCHAELPTGRAHVAVDRNGANSIVVVPGAIVRSGDRLAHGRQPVDANAVIRVQAAEHHHSPRQRSCSTPLHVFRLTAMDATSVAERVTHVWDADALPAITDYIRIPNVSPAFDADWAANGHMHRAVDLVESWLASRPVTGATVEVVTLAGRTPVIIVDVPGTSDDTVLLYGHLDKQPPMVGWRDGLGPWQPVLDGDRLYGRGAGDDGYAAFAAMTAIEAVQQADGRHARCLVLIEASEESGSPDLPAYIDALADRIGTPSLVICLDSGCASLDRLWVTTSLRGLLALDVTVRVLDEGVHSGSAGGVVPSTFRILRYLLDRIEDVHTGELLVPELHVTIPPDRAAELADTAGALGAEVAGEFPFTAGAAAVAAGDPVAQLRAKTWEPTMELIGIDGVPSVVDGGNVLRPFTTARLSFRLPPTCDPESARDALVRTLTTDPPYGASVTVSYSADGSGWNAPPTEPWLRAAIDEASKAAFGAPARSMGEGGTIPFMAMLGARFPAAQFVITGVLGPGSNAHGPNEFLDLPTAKAVTVAVAHILDAHARRDA